MPVLLQQNCSPRRQGGRQHGKSCVRAYSAAILMIQQCQLANTIVSGIRVLLDVSDESLHPAQNNHPTRSLS